MHMSHDLDQDEHVIMLDKHLGEEHSCQMRDLNSQLLILREHP